MFAGLTAWSAAAQQDRVVAMVVSVGQGTARADALQANLQVLGAETLRAADPSNAELRSILKRFADEAVNTSASLVYLDMPAVLYDGRAFVLPADIELRRPSDLFTRAVPLSAFARAAAQAGEGGAVMIAVGQPRQDMRNLLPPLEAAPEPVPGASPILVAAYGASDPLVRIFATLDREETIEIGDVLDRLAAAEGVSLSDRAAAPAYLRRPAAAVAPEAPGALLPEGAPEAQTEEELAVLEQSISRSAKRALQRGLRERGHYQGLLDGIFGPQTRQAILEFQEAQGDAATGYLTGRQMLDLR
ncbi:MAG: peptidoglycan-binding domain-containing protein [Pseudomonadota bacterium]